MSVCDELVAIELSLPRPSNEIFTQFVVLPPLAASLCLFISCSLFNDCSHNLSLLSVLFYVYFFLDDIYTVVHNQSVNDDSAGCARFSL